MKILNVGVMGLGMGRRHLEGFAACPQARVVALCDSDEERLAAEAARYPQASVHRDCRDMLAGEDLDAVAVALPNHLHAPVTLECLRSGRHVLCEKPMAMNAREAEAMQQEAERLGRVLMMHFNMRFMTTAATLRPLIDRGVFGQIYHLTTTYTRRNGYPRPGSWFGQKDKSGGGPLIDLGVHRLDLALWLMGYPTPTTVTGMTGDRLARTRMAAYEFDCEDFASAFIRFENGASLYIASSWDGHQARPSDITMNIYGTEASAFECNGAITLCSGDGEEPAVEALELQEPAESPQQHFVHAVCNGQQPGPSAAHGVVVMRLLDAVYESARTGREVKL